MVQNNLVIPILVAQKKYPLGGHLEGIGPLGQVFEKGIAHDIGAAVGLFNYVISIIIGAMTVGAGLWFIFQFLVAGFQWLGAGGNKEAVAKAQGRMTSAIIGLVIVVAAIFLIDVIGRILGFKILQPGEFIKGVWWWQ
jgi:hypothetical protein